MDIASARVIVTGGASGLGAATARDLAAAGARVTIFDRDTERGAAMAEAAGGTFAEVDVTDEASVAAGIARAVKAMGGISAVVNCAGIVTGAKTVGSKGPFPLDAFRRTIDINLVGAFNVARLAAVEMAKNDPDAEGERGVIVNTASIAAFDGQKGQAAYSASKAGVAGLSLPMARDMGSLGIRVNAIAPGLFLTPMLESLGPEMMEELASDVVFPRRLGRPEEFARLARVLIEMPYLNGETIRLDGALRLP
ncbi:SDR family NAD(P)-dependent oxidoreductase [Rhodobacteraceae bacterium W635]|uniref:SDR family NAD(P)-dependent oxidoreductase n=1 Tax=Nioella halotolerans TaxID=2303578 RepID=UPI000E3D2B71|nr:SDR family NAD(P)-dependent oxidoreductase [Rhodobacteraceae bacterium W635]